MDQAVKDTLERIRNTSLDMKITRSLTILKEILTIKDKNIPLIINFSGGKDSTAILVLAKKLTNNVECCYADGGFELPTTLTYVRQQCKKFNVKLHMPVAGEVKLSHRKNGSLKNCHTLSDFVKHYRYFPTSGLRWCSIWLKQRLMKAYWRTIYDKRVILYKCNGVRMFESKVRLWKYGDPKHYRRFTVKDNYFLRYDNEHHPCILIYPIIEWTSEDVIEFLNRENIQLHDGYKLFGVSGCKWCPVYKREIYKKILKVYPNIYEDFINLENKINQPCIESGKYWLRDI